MTDDVLHTAETTAGVSTYRHRLGTHSVLSLREGERSTVSPREFHWCPGVLLTHFGQPWNIVSSHSIDKTVLGSPTGESPLALAPVPGLVT